MNLILFAVGFGVAMRFVMNLMKDDEPQEKEKPEVTVTTEPVKKPPKEEPKKEEPKKTSPYLRYTPAPTKSMVVSELVQGLSRKYDVSKKDIEMMMNKDTQICHSYDITEMRELFSIRTADGEVIDLKFDRGLNGRLNVVNVNRTFTDGYRRNEKGQIVREKFRPYC